jgi:mono/diheme cytochrome c family protein
VAALQERAGEDLGAQLFRTYCAACHGPAGGGDGPVARQLLEAPRDLTRFAERNGGVFPGDRIYDIIDGRGIRAHGSGEMPVWGDVFSGSPIGLDERGARQRIEAIVAYLRAIQRRRV